MTMTSPPRSGSLSARMPHGGAGAGDQFVWQQRVEFFDAVE
jgi:hypothetical protein